MERQGIQCTVEYEEGRSMWRVNVYAGGEWRMTHWFHSESAARFWAARQELGG